MLSCIPSQQRFLSNRFPSSTAYRSAAEAQLDSSSKYRQLPCKTLISVGTCPYGERCVFLHDPRLVCHISTPISRLKNKEDSVADSFFWPLTAPESGPNKKGDNNFRQYSVPAMHHDQYQLHDQALYSLWQHYVEFCKITGKAQKSTGPRMAPQDIPVNIFTQRPRLPVFRQLSACAAQPSYREPMRSSVAESHAVKPSVQTHQGVMQSVQQDSLHHSPNSVGRRLSFSGTNPDSAHIAAAAKFATYDALRRQEALELRQSTASGEHKSSLHEQFRLPAASLGLGGSYDLPAYRTQLGVSASGNTSFASQSTAHGGGGWERGGGGVRKTASSDWESLGSVDCDASLASL